MSTNYYWHIPHRVQTMANGEKIETTPCDLDPRWHIGKLSAGTFTWAQAPHDVLTACRERGCLLAVVDEYGDEMTGDDFADMLAGCLNKLDMIGEAFC